MTIFLESLWKFFILEHFRVAEFKNFSTMVKVFSLRKMHETPSFWNISEQQNSKFPSTMVKIFSVVFTKSLNFGAFHIVITLNLGGKWHFQASGKEKSHNFLEGFALHFWQQSVKSISFSLLSQ